jgi:hypothetical protein
MRIPSRRMPKVVERKAGPFPWLFLCIMPGALLNMVLFHPLVIGIFLGVIAVAAVVGRIHTQQMRRLAATRAGEGVCEFARAFNTRKIDTWIIRAVYEEVQACLASEFPLRASDRLREDLHIDPDDLDMEIAMRVSERTGRSLREPKRNPYYRVGTVGDLVNFFNSQPYSVPVSRVV